MRHLAGRKRVPKGSNDVILAHDFIETSWTPFPVEHRNLDATASSSIEQMYRLDD